MKTSKERPKLYRPNLDEIVADSIREQIIDHDLKSGEKLSEERICEDLGISRTPVRLALNRLTREGFLTSAPRRSAVVKAYTLKDLLEICQIRVMIENLAIRMAARNAVSRQIESMESLLNEHESMLKEKQGDVAPPYSLFWRKDYAFHRAILEASGNRQLVELEKGNSFLLKSFFLVDFPGVRDTTSSLEDHRQIIGLLKVRDENEAERVIVRHLARLVGRLQELLQEKGDIPVDSPELASDREPQAGRKIS